MVWLVPLAPLAGDLRQGGSRRATLAEVGVRVTKG